MSEDPTNEPTHPPVPRKGGPSDADRDDPDAPLPDDDPIAELVERAQSGDPDAMNELFARFHQTMVEVARRKLGPRLRLKEDPDDLAQTTFREATRDFSSYEYQGQGSLLRWLIQILQNKIRDKAEFYSAGKRDLSRERAFESGEGEEESEPRTAFDLASADLSVTQVVQRGEDFDILRESLRELTEEHRKAITLVFFEGLSLREAGERLGGRSEDAVRMMLRRAEAKLGEKLRSSIGKHRSKD